MYLCSALADFFNFGGGDCGFGMLRNKLVLQVAGVHLGSIAVVKLSTTSDTLMC